MARDQGKKPEGREIKQPRSPHAERSARWKDWFVSKRVQDRILKRQQERHDRDEGFRRKDRGRV